MEREKIPPEQMLQRLDEIDELLKDCAAILSDALLGRKKITDFTTYDLILIVQVIHLANCDIYTDSEEACVCFEKNLQARFLSLINLHKFLAVLPQTDDRSLRELAMTAIQARDIYCSNRREEYANNFIASLTILADEIARNKKTSLTG
jgi:hypothetical protein